MRFSPRRRNTFSTSSLQDTPLWDLPHSEIRLCCRDLPLPKTRLHSSVDVISPTRKRMRTLLGCRDFLLSDAQPRNWYFPYSGTKICRNRYGTNIHLGTTRRGSSKHLGVKTNSPNRHPIPNESDGKTNQERSKQHFHFEN